ncbi:MAG: DUF3880 domain-containing protein [Elusimicrobiota bacterium]|nr:DUF3880 domain-containing protein [Elusimicrobiota bacterium]
MNYVKLNSRVVKTVPLGCAPEIHKKVELSDEEKERYERYGSDVCFVGTVKFK